MISGQIYGAAMETDFIASGCDYAVDLDFDNSSGAINSDYQDDSPCGNNTLPISDTDVDVIIDGPVDSMQIYLSSGVQDGVNEYLIFSGSTSMTVLGSGTEAMTFISTGNVTEADLEDIIANVTYINAAANYTPGERQVTVVFYATDGNVSNEAIAFLTLEELPSYTIDLGNDTTLCVGESLLLDAATPWSMSYEWQDGSIASSF